MRQEYLEGKVLDKYKLPNGNIGIVVNQRGTDGRYHVEFRDPREKPEPKNLWGLLTEPFSYKTEYLDHLVEKGDTIGLSVNYTLSPFRRAFRIYSMGKRLSDRVQNLQLRNPAYARASQRY